MKSRGFVFDGMAYTSVLHACQQLGLAQEAIDYLRMMKAKTSSYQRRTAGRQVASRLPDLVGPDEVAYLLVISACARGRALKEALEVLDEFCAQHPAGGDVVAFTAAITACEYVGDWKTALSLLERMRRADIQPNEVTFAAVIGACATSLAGMEGRIPDSDALSSLPLPQLKALQLLQLMKRDASLPNPNIVVYNAVIRACAEAMDLRSALKLLGDLRSEGLEPTIVTFGCLMTACERVGSASAASKVFKSLREDGLEPNEIIYGAAISCCRKAGERERALLLLKKMIREDQKPNVAVFNTVLTAQTDGSPSEQDIENALLTYKILRQYKHATPNRQTYNIIIRSLAAQRHPRQAEKLLNDMQEDGLVPDVDLFTATVTAYERMGQPLKALNLMESMRRKGYDFYESAVLNTAFKKAVKLVNAVGRGLVPPDENEEQSATTTVFGLKPR
jgi:pentatricopeptide repeat protein